MEYLKNYHFHERLPTREVTLGSLKMGGVNPLVVQSMTTADTLDTEKTVNEILSLKRVGCQLVRLTVPSLKVAKNLENIKNRLIQKNQDVPLVADIHFTPNAALKAAEIVEKVRINPGNFYDRKHFKEVDLSTEEYSDEIKRIKDKFIPLLEVCQKHKTVLRIGANQGSLSDRVVTRYGDSPLGMVESALEFLQMAEEYHFFDIVFSMKSSNPLVMVAAYRLLVKRLKMRGRGLYPIHLGVTEAGNEEEGRIKSTLGIASLLSDGIGDTIRVSLTEDSEKEILVAEKIKNYFSKKNDISSSLKAVNSPINPYEFKRQTNRRVLEIGGNLAPKVILGMSSIGKLTDLEKIGFVKDKVLDKWESQDLVPDFVFLENPPTTAIPPSLKVIEPYSPLSPSSPLPSASENLSSFKFFKTLEEYQTYWQIKNGNFDNIKNEEPVFVVITLENLKYINENSFHLNVILVLEDESFLPAFVLRNFIFHLKEKKIAQPIIVSFPKNNLKKILDSESKIIYLSAYFGPLLVDGLIDGIFLNSNESLDNVTLFNILQASRQRIFKTEFISCPSCGRTLFDLQKVTAKIKEKTEHLKGVKIAIMGCIVNGPGEMADADFGYVGSGPERVTLYKAKTPVLRNIPSEKAVFELINLIKKEGLWKEKNIVY